MQVILLLQTKNISALKELTFLNCQLHGKISHPHHIIDDYCKHGLNKDGYSTLYLI